MNERKCVVCDTKLQVNWTDTNGVAQCHTCNTPYKLSKTVPPTYMIVPMMCSKSISL